MIFPRWELRHTADPLDTRAYGGGEDGGAQAMRDEELARQRKVQDAVDAINVRFGTPSSGGAAEPGRDAFWKPASRTFANDEWTDNPAGVDEAAYAAAVQQWQAQQGAAGVNRTAREAQYADIADAVKQTAMRDLDRQYGKASQKNTFGLARAGQLGGSVDAESGGELATLYGEGKLKATQAGQQSASELRMTDEKTRQNLVSLAQSGLDTGTAASMAAGQMSAAADSSRSLAAGATVGRLFDDMSQAYVVSQVGKARYPTAGQQQPSSYSTGVFNPSRYTGRVQQ